MNREIIPPGVLAAAVSTKADNQDINPLVAELLKASLIYVESRFIELIKDEDVKQGVSKANEVMINMINIMSDGLPNTSERVKAIWLEFINQDLVDLGQIKLEDLAEKINDPKLRAIITLLIAPIVDTIQVLTDGKPNADNEIKSIWTDFIKNGSTQDTIIEGLLIPLLETVIKDKSTVRFIGSLIKLALGGL